MRRTAVLVLVALAGCLDNAGEPAPTTSNPAPTSSMPAPGEVYVVASDAGANPDGVYAMRPEEQHATLGEPVVVTIKGAIGNLQSHTLVIEGFDLRLGPVASGETANETVTFDQEGTFAFFCDVGNHRELGMEGTLTVSR